jgi:serine/threonine protein kinase
MITARVEFPELDFKGNQRFAIRRRLGAGGMGVVYEAFDRERSHAVALKTLLHMDPEALYRFKHEFRALADLSHPNLVRLGDLVCEDGRWFFTMELVEGTDFMHHVRPGLAPPLDTLPTVVGRPGAEAPQNIPDSRVLYDEERLRRALVQLVGAVAALHEHGKVHRDIKPSNILVTPEGRVVLLDFGLIAEMKDEHQLSQMQVVGTADYMAPEQAALRPVGPEADWYSVGCVLFQALTGRLPFWGSPIDMMVAKQQKSAPAARMFVPEVARDLGELCAALLRIDPTARPTVKEILARIGSPAAKTTPAAPLAHATPFVGRRDELRSLEKAYADVCEGHPKSVFVHGESGVGKTALVRYFLDGLRIAPLPPTLLVGRCYERESVPFKAFDGIVDGLSLHLAQLDQVKAALLLPEEAPLLARVFPVLRRVPAISQATQRAREIRDPQQLRARAFLALRRLLVRLAAERPLVLFIDDFQWADADSLALLRDVCHPPEAPAFLLLATVRSGWDASAVDALGAVEHLRLGGLSPDETRQLLELLHAGTSQALAEETRGHPLFIQELSRYLAAAGPNAQHDIRLDDALWSRVSQLEAPARRLLELLAIAGAPISQAIAGATAGLEPAEMAHWVDLLRATNLVKTSGSRAGDTVEAYHDRVREAVVAHLDPLTQKSHHRAIADRLEAEGLTERDPRVIVRHLEAAGETQRAAQRAAAGARIASEKLAFDQAAALYETALRLGGQGAAEARQLRLLMGEAFANAGRCQEAAEAFLGAAEAADIAVRLDCQRRAAEQLLIGGHIDRGLQTISAVLHDLGVGFPATPRAALVSLVRRRIWLRLRGLRWKPRDPTAIPARDLMRLDVYRAIALGLAAVDNIRGAEFQARGLLLALRIGEPVRVARSLALEAIYRATQGRRSLASAHALIDQARGVAESSGDPYLRGWIAGAQANIAYYSGRFRDAAERFVGAEALFRDETVGATWELNNVRIFRLQALRYMGALADLRRSFDHHIRDAVRRGDRYAEATLTRAFNQVWLAADNTAAARRDLDQKPWSPPSAGFHVQHWYELRARAELALYEGKGFAELDEGFALLESSLLLRVQTVRSEAAWVRGRLALARGDLATARKLAKALAAERIGYATVWSGLLRAALAAKEGPAEECTRTLRATIADAEEIDLVLCAEAARFWLGTLAGGPQAARQLAQAESWMKQEGIAQPRRMLDVIAPGFARE